MIDSGCAVLSAAIALDRTNIDFFVQRARIYWLAGDAVRTISDLNEVLRRNNRHAEAYRIRGLAHARRGDTTNTVADLTRAINLNVRDAEVYLARADANVRRNQRPAAIADYRAVLAIDAGNQLANDGLRRLGQQGQAPGPLPPAGNAGARAR